MSGRLPTTPSRTAMRCGCFPSAVPSAWSRSRTSALSCAKGLCASLTRKGARANSAPSMTTVTMPQLGESVMEGTVVRWIARPGQKVERDEPLVEIATDKANTEIPSPSAGVLVEQLAKEGAVGTVGGALARLDEAGTAAAAAAPQSQAKPAPKAAPATPTPEADENGVRATPVGRNVAQEHGLDLSKVPG